MDASQKLEEWGRNIGAWLKAGYPVVLLLILSGVALYFGAMSLSRTADRRATEWTGQLTPLLVQDTLQGLVDSVKGSRLEQIRLSDQMRTIRRRLEHHSSMMAYFYGRQFLVITISTVSAVLAASLLVLITQGGWKEASPPLRAAFLVSAATAAMFASFPALYRQEQNILDNATLYQGYLALRNEMLSYLATGQRLSGKNEPAAAFIHYIDSGLVSLGRVAIGFDATKIPHGGDLLKQIK